MASNLIRNFLNLFVKKTGDTMTGNLTMSTGEATEYSAQTGDSTITRNIALQALDDYSRAWVTSLDKNSRNQASIGWHGINFGDGIDHHAFEIKTSVSPTNPTPDMMQTRFAVQSDKDLSSIVMNYLQSLIMYKGDGSSTITFQVDADTGKITTVGTSDQPNLSMIDSTGAEARFGKDTSNYIGINKKNGAGSQLKAVDQTGSSTLDLDAVPSDGTSSAIVRLFRNTSTTSTASSFSVYKGDGTATIQHFFGSQSNAYVNASTGSFMVGKTSSPLAKLDVNGDIQVGTKLKITTGTNASAGTGTLSAGTVTVSTTAVTANSLIFLTDTSNGANIGVLSVGTKTPGTSFVVNSSNALDSSTFNWLIIN